MTTGKSAAGIVLILGAAALWGTTGTAQTFTPLSLSSLWVGTARLLIASVFFHFCLAIINPVYLKPASLNSLPFALLLVAAMGMAVYNLAFFAGIRLTSVAGGTALALGSGPVWAGLIESIYTRQLPPKSWWLGVGVAIFGLYLVGGESAYSNGWPLHGIGLCLLSGLSYAVYGLCTKRILTSTTPLASVTAVFTLAALMAFVVAGIFTEVPEVRAEELIVLLWLGVFATGIAYLLFSCGLRYLNSRTGIALALAEPVAALLLAITIVGERPAIATYIGIGTLLMGLTMLILCELRANPKCP